MSGAWNLDLRPERRPRNPFGAVPAHPIREDQLRSWAPPKPDTRERRFQPDTLCFELPPRERFVAQPMFQFVHARTGKVLRRFNAVNREEAELERDTWCARVGRFAPHVSVVLEVRA